MIEHLVVLGVLAASAAAMAANEKTPPDRAKAATPRAGGAKADTKAAEAAKAANAAKAGPDGGTAGPDGTTADPAEAPEEDGLAQFLASVPHIVGPKPVSLGHHAELQLPAGMNLLEETQAQELMRKMGNHTDGVVAVVLPPVGSTSSWMVVIGASDVGYVDDDDADELDSAEMLEQFKQGTLEQNKKRVQMGIPELVIDGWSERPHYARAMHHLVWGLNAHDTESKVVNYFTRFLGRMGFLSVNLIDDPATIEASKAQALSVLNAVHFELGSRYEDHVSSDRDSGIGLKALVLGGAGVVIAKKTGILVAVLLFLKKGIVVIAIAIGGFFRWLFRRKKDDAAA